MLSQAGPVAVQRVPGQVAVILSGQTASSITLQLWTLSSGSVTTPVVHLVAIHD
jgi:hypothetical protein